MPSLAFLLKGTGALLILHAGYSCMHYRSILMDLDLLDATSSSSSSSSAAATGDIGSEAATAAAATTTSMMIPPVDVYIEVALAFALLLLGQLLGMGPLQSVELVSSNSTTDTSTNNERYKPLAAQAYKTRDFDVYNNRSRMLLQRSVAAKTR